MIGHTAQKQYFLEAFKAGNLAHAYTLVGHEGVGKRTLANEVAAELFKVPVEKVTVNPNYMYVSRLEDEKTGKLKKEISVTQARELRSRLAGSVWGGEWRIVVIDEVEILSIEASNALLKLLEEPPKNTAFFLLTTNDQFLLPTIKSRSQNIFLPLIGDHELHESMNVSDEIIKLAWGRPGRAKMLVDDAEKLSWYKTETKRWNDLQNAALFQKIKLVENLYGDKDDAVRGREVLQDVLELWSMLAREQMLLKKADRAGLIDEIFRSRELLNKNVHPRLIVENILIHL